jgi:hypothetical protein
LASALLGADASVDLTSLYLRAEDSEFLRFNQAKLRQATQVQQAYVTLAVERGQRRAESTLSLTGETGADIQRLQQERALLVSQLDLLADDPWLTPPPPAARSQRDDRGALGRVAAEFAASEANIVNVTMDEEPDRVATIRFTLQVHGRQHLAQVFRQVRKQADVTKITRL